MSKQYTITINKNEETPLSSQAQLSVQVPQFKREHYVLSCWKDAAGNTYDKDGSITISEDTVISAQWIGKQYSVTLNKDGGTCTDLTSYRYAQEATLPTDWTKEGYTFVGWKNNSELTGENFTKISSGEYGDKEFWAASTLNKVKISYNTNWENQ